MQAFEVLRILSQLAIAITRFSGVVSVFSPKGGTTFGNPDYVFYKNEGVSPAGSHKLPTRPFRRPTTTKSSASNASPPKPAPGNGAARLSMACAMFGLQCKVFMVRISFDQKPYRKFMMAVWGAECVPSPSKETRIGREVLAKYPDTPGSLGIAISEPIEQAVEGKDTRYSLGSVLNHVMLHQTVIGLEAKKQMEKIGEYPNVIIGCVGGGSNFAGLAFPFTLDKIHGKDIDIIPVEPAAVRTLPATWQTASHFNPFFYMIDGFRYGFFGVSDYPPLASLAVVGVSCLLLCAAALGLLRSGYKLRH